MHKYCFHAVELLTIATVVDDAIRFVAEEQEMNEKRQAEWRRNQVLELSSKGLTQSDIAKILQISISTISRDLYFLREQAKDNLKIVSVSRKK